jgi:hypothetical protein
MDLPADAHTVVCHWSGLATLTCQQGTDHYLLANLLTNSMVIAVIAAIAGASVAVIWSWLREREVWRQAKLSALRELIREIDVQYRASKHIRRLLRSRRDPSKDRKIDVGFLESRLDELSDVQLKIEMARNSVRAMTGDTIDPKRRDRIVFYLGYTATYFRKVLGHFENRDFIKCSYLRDFLDQRWKPPTKSSFALKNAWNDFASGTLPESGQSSPRSIRDPGQASMSDEIGLNEDPSSKVSIPYVKRFEAFKELMNHGELPAKTRNGVRAIADECMLQAMRELREEIQLSLPFGLRQLFKLHKPPKWDPRYDEACKARAKQQTQQQETQKQTNAVVEADDTLPEAEPAFALA